MDIRLGLAQEKMGAAGDERKSKKGSVRPSISILSRPRLRERDCRDDVIWRDFCEGEYYRPDKWEPAKGDALQKPQ